MLQRNCYFFHPYDRMHLHQFKSTGIFRNFLTVKKKMTLFCLVTRNIRFLFIPSPLQVPALSWQGCIVLRILNYKILSKKFMCVWYKIGLKCAYFRNIWYHQKVKCNKNWRMNVCLLQLWRPIIQEIYFIYLEFVYFVVEDYLLELSRDHIVPDIGLPSSK